MSLGFLIEKRWIYSLVPSFNLFSVPVDLFEANELLLHKDATSIVEVMSWHVFKVLDS